VLKPNDSSISIYCDTFVLDIILSGGDGGIESTTLVTIVKDQSKQFPERDEDLFQSLLALVAGDSQPFTTKLYRLVNRAELAVKFPQTNFEELEDTVFTKLQQVCTRSPKWSVTRGVDGLLIRFKDELQCFPLYDNATPEKRAKFEEAGEDLSDDRGQGGWLEWTGCVTFTEWRSSVVMHVLCDTPLIMSGIQSRRLAAAILGFTDDMREKAFVELANKAPSATKAKEDKSAFPISIESHLRFVRETSTNIVMTNGQNFGLQLECSLVTKEIAGGVNFHSFPIPVRQSIQVAVFNIIYSCYNSTLKVSLVSLGLSVTVFTFNRFLQVASLALTMYLAEAILPMLTTQVLQQACMMFSGFIYIFLVLMQVEVAAPTSMTLKLTSEALEGEDFHIDVETKEDYTMQVRLRNQPAMNNAASQISAVCHSLPLLCYFLLQSNMKASVPLSEEDKLQDVDAMANDTTDVVDDDDMTVGSDILLDDENFF
ncbi:hypothetical protein THRCLA_06581, partial [Thraustotheca clavata]